MVWPKNVFSLQFVMLIVCVSKLSRRWSETQNKPRACVSRRSILSLHLMQNWRRWGAQCEHRTVFGVEAKKRPRVWLPREAEDAENDQMEIVEMGQMDSEYALSTCNFCMLCGTDLFCLWWINEVQVIVAYLFRYIFGSPRPHGI